MKTILAKYLEKLGYTSIDQLSKDKMPDGSPSELETFKEWDKILSKNDEVTVDNIRQFCRSQLEEVGKQMENIDNKADKIQRLVILHTVYSKILRAIDSPQSDRVALEQYLNSLIGGK